MIAFLLHVGPLVLRSHFASAPSLAVLLVLYEAFQIGVHKYCARNLLSMKFLKVIL